MTPADVAALGDVVDRIAEEADSMTPHDAVLMMEALAALGRRVSAASGMCQSAAIAQLEGQPITVDDRTYVPKSYGTWRPQHHLIQHQVIRHTAYDLGTGEVVSGREAAEAAVALMYDLFIAPSTMPKVGALEKMGLTRQDVGEYERKGIRLELER